MSVEAITWAFTQSAPSTGAKLALVALANSASEYGICYPGRKLLAARCDCTPETMTARVKLLEGAGLIKRLARRRENGSKTSDWYVLAPRAADRGPMLDCPGTDHPKQVAALARRGGQEGLGEETSPKQSSGEEDSAFQVKKTGGPPEPSVEPSGTATPQEGPPEHDEIGDDFRGWLSHHWATTGMDPPAEGMKEWRHLEWLYRCRRGEGREDEGCTARDLELATEGVYADDWQRKKGWHAPARVLRDKGIGERVESGRQVRKDAEKGGGWAAWVARELPDLDRARAASAAFKCEQLTAQGVEVTPAAVVERLRERYPDLESEAA